MDIKILDKGIFNSSQIFPLSTYNWATDIEITNEFNQHYIPTTDTKLELKIKSSHGSLSIDVTNQEILKNGLRAGEKKKLRMVGILPNNRLTKSACENIVRNDDTKVEIELNLINLKYSFTLKTVEKIEVEMICEFGRKLYVIINFYKFSVFSLTFFVSKTIFKVGTLRGENATKF